VIEFEAAIVGLTGKMGCYNSSIMIIDFSRIKLLPADESYNEFLFQARKEAFAWLIRKVWGKWEESFQRNIFADEYKGCQPILILYNSQIVGSYTCTKITDHYDFGNFFILPKYQNQGIGSFVLNKVLAVTDEAGWSVRLVYWDFNPAGHLYARMGFKSIGRHIFEGRKAYWVIVERQPGKKRSNKEDKPEEKTST
jgi:GNAT superfamily N-acetyltransferase